MSEDEIEVVKGIKENPTTRELLLISIIDRLEYELNKKDKVIDLMYQDIENEYMGTSYMEYYDIENYYRRAEEEE